MHPSEHNEVPKTGQTMQPARPPSRNGRVLSVIHSKDERSLHLSPILQQIKDDGPALIDGEVVKDSRFTPKLAKPAAGSDPKASAAATLAAASQPLFADRYVKGLLGFCVALTVGLCASLYFSWQQQQRIANVEYLLEALVAGTDVAPDEALRYE